MQAQNRAAVIVVGPLGFEPRIACAPGMYPNPNQRAYSQDRWLGTSPKLDDGPALDNDPAFNDYTAQVKKCLDTLAGKSQNTKTSVFYTLQKLNHEADLMNPEAVRLYIGNNDKLQNSTKQKHANNYDYFVQANGLQWQKPIYKQDEKIPPTPTREQAEAIISSAPRINSATIFRILLESGYEGEELHSTTEKDIDTETGTIRIAGHKQHDGRAYTFKQSTADLLRVYMAKPTHKRQHPFPRPEVMGEQWRVARERASQKLSRPDLKKYPLKGLRNLSGIIVFTKTKNPWTVMLHMGHKKLDTTQHYLSAMSKQQNECEWTCKIASTPQERMKLIEEGYTLVEKDGADWYFKIPK